MITREFRRAVEQAVSNMMGLPRFVPLATPKTSSSFNGDSFSTVGTATQIDTSSVFGLPAGVKAILLEITVRDSGSAAATNLYLEVGPSATITYALSCRPHGRPDDSWESVLGIVPCDVNGNVWYKILASNVDTMDVWLRIFGYWL